MSPVVHQALRVLQQRAYAQVLHAVGQVRSSTATPALLSHTDKAHERIVRCEMEIDRLRLSMTREQLVELKISRALYLRMLLSSASTRLQSWSDLTRLEQTPPSHLHEWLSHDLEQLELAEVEASMTQGEAVWYLQASLPFDSAHY